MNVHNLKNKLEADSRRAAAFQEWLIEKNHIKEIALKHNTDPTKFKKYIVEQGHSFDTANYNVFDVIDSEEKAYWLGFLFADGYVATKTNLVELSLQKSDYRHLEKFKLFMQADQNIKIDDFRCRIFITNKHLKETLINLGCTPLKSKTIKFPNIDSNLHRHFIRGYFDGDGCISRTYNQFLWNTASVCSGSEVFIKDLCNILEKELQVLPIIYKKSKSSVWFVGFVGKNFITIMDYMYENSSIYLDRKFLRANNSIAVFDRNIE